MEKMHDIGDFRHRLTIMRDRVGNERILDAGGNLDEDADNTIVVGKRYAKIQTARQGFQMEAANKLQEINTHIVTLRNDTLTRNITAKYWFVRNGLKYQINSAPDQGFENRQFCRFDCKALSGDK